MTRSVDRKRGKLKDDTVWAWGMLLPNIIGFLMFMLIPMVATFVLSFTNYDMLTAPKFIGIQNYITMAKDPIVRQVTLNTIIYTVLTVPIGMCISLFLAVMLDQKISKILQGGLFSSIYNFYGCSCYSMAVDL